MTITYPDGTSVRAIQMARAENTLRVAVPGEEDARIFQCVNGTWLSEELEVVTIEFEWQRKKLHTIPHEADCICSSELAAKLIEQFQVPEIDELEERLRKLAQAQMFATASGSRMVS